MADPRNDKSAYDKSRYTSRAREGRAPGAAPVGGPRRERRPDEERPAAADLGSEYSRDNAARRYATRERHVSNGRESVAHRLDRMHGGAAAAGGTRWGKRAALAVVIVVVLAIVGWYLQVSLAMRPSDDVSGSVSGPGIGKPYYVLLMGSDSRDEAEDTARADSMILCRVDEAAKQVTMVSMPRDLLVEIPGHGKGKLNSALAYEGYSGAIDAVSKVAGVPISYYATIYFSGFEKLVDDLGGVTVQVPEGTYYDGVWVPAGDASRINGKEALVLARCRHGNPPDQGGVCRRRLSAHEKPAQSDEGDRQGDHGQARLAGARARLDRLGVHRDEHARMEDRRARVRDARHGYREDVLCERPRLEQAFRRRVVRDLGR